MPKTTVELPASLLAEAKETAAREGTTLRALVEAGLRAVLERRKVGGDAGFALRDASVDGKGLRPEFRGAGWDAVRDSVYDGRGA